MKTSTFFLNVFKKVVAGILILSVGSVSAVEIQVPENHATIQAAVDAATDGDTIHIAPGIYVEQVFINNKSLTLVGQPGTVLRAFPNMALGGGWNRWTPILYIQQSSDVSVRGIRFEGDQLADQQEPGRFGFSGVYFVDSGGTIENCHFTGFREKTPGNNGAFAIRMWNNLQGATLFSATVRDNTIEDSYTGINLLGAPDKISYNFLISNNTIRGVGPSTTGGIDGMRGIGLGRGATGSVIGNTVSGFAYLDDGVTETAYPWAWGIIAVFGDVGNYFPLEYMRFENNTLLDNDLHMALVRADESEVLNNRFEGTGGGASQDIAGLWFSGENLRVEGNEFREMELGVRAGPGSVNTGYAINATMTDNRFCDVVMPVDVARGSNVTETGTLNCPFPEPDLGIARAVRLAWPGYYYDDYVLESAPTAEGPWSVVVAELREEDGMLVALVAADSENQFFRLRSP